MIHEGQAPSRAHAYTNCFVSDTHPAGSKAAPKTEDVDLGGDNPFADLSQDNPFAEEHEDSSPANKGRTTPARGVKKEVRAN